MRGCNYENHQKKYTLINTIKFAIAFITFLIIIATAISYVDIFRDNLTFFLFALATSFFILISSFRLLTTYYKDTDEWSGLRKGEYSFLSFKDFYNLYKLQKSLFDLEPDGPKVAYKADTMVRVLFKTITEYLLYRLFRMKYREKEYVCDNFEIDGKKLIQSVRYINTKGER